MSTADNREIVYAIRMRNEARAAISQFAGDMTAAFRQIQQAAAALGSNDPFAALARSAQQAQNDIRSATSSITGSFNALSGSVNASANNATSALGRVTAAAQRTAQAVAQANSAAGSVKPGATTPGGSGRPPGARPYTPPTNPTPPAPSHADTGFGSAFKEATENVIGFKEAILGAAAAAAALFEVGEVLKMADEYKALNSQIRMVSNSQREAAGTYQQLFSASNQNMQSLESTVTLYTRIAKATQGLGVTQADVAITTDAIGKAMKSFQGNQHIMELGVYEFTVGLEQGSIQGRQLRSVLQELPPLANAIAAGMGITTATLHSFAEQGKLTARDVIAAIVAQHDAIAANAAMIQTTASQSFVVLKNSIEDAIGSADTATGATATFAKAVLGLAQSLRDPAFQGQLQAFMTSMGSSLTLMTHGVQLAVQNIGYLTAAIGALVVRFAITPVVNAAMKALGNFGNEAIATVAKVGLLRGAMAGMSAALGGPWGIALLAVSAFAAGVTYLNSRTTATQSATQSLADSVDVLRENYQRAGDAAKFLSDTDKDAATARIREQIQNLQGKNSFLDSPPNPKSILEQPLQSQSKAAMGLIDGQKDVNDFPEIMAQFKILEQGFKDGKPDVLAFRDALSSLGDKARNAGNNGLADMARQVLANSKTVTDYVEALQGLQDRLAYIDNKMDEMTRKNYEIKMKIREPEFDINSLNINTIGSTLQNSINKLRDSDPDTKKLEEAHKKQDQITTEYKNGLNSLNVVLNNGTYDTAQYVAHAKELATAYYNAITGASGYKAEVEKLGQELNKLQTEALPDGRNKDLAGINTKYDQLAASMRKSGIDGAYLKDVLQKIEDLRKQDTSNIDAKLANAAADRTRQLTNELAVSQLLLQSDRTRLLYQQQLEEQARKGGSSNPTAFVQKGMQEYDQTQSKITRNNFDNGSLADNLRSLSEESATLGMTTRERERYTAGMKIADEARKAGLTTWDQELQKFYQEYDALQKSKDAYNTFGQGLKTALDDRLEATRNVAQESAKFWSSTFDSMENTLEQFVMTGKLNIAGLLSSIAADFAKFSVRQLMSAFLGNVFGTPGTSGAGTGIFGLGGAGILGGILGGTPTNTSSVPTSIATTATGVIAPTIPVTSSPLGAIGSTVTNMATQAVTSAGSALGSILNLGNPNVANAITSVSASSGIPVSDLATMAKIESGFNPNDTTGSNHGLMQFSPDQYKSLGITDPNDPFQSTKAAALEWNNNKSALSSYLGRDPTSAELYEAHQQGLAGSKALLGGDQSQSAVSAIQKFYNNDTDIATRAIVGNGGTADMTKGQFNDMWTNKWNAQQQALFKNGTLTSDGIVQAPQPVTSQPLAPLTNVNPGSSGLLGTDLVAQQTKALQQSMPQLTNDLNSTFQGVATQTQSTFGSTFTSLGGTFQSTMGQSIQGVGTQFSSIFSGIGNAGGATGGGGGIFSALGSIFGFHRGGMVGSSGSLSRTMSMAHWAGAPKFHTGGIVGSLSKGERPIIAKDGEAVMPTVRMPDGSFGVRSIGQGNSSGGVTNHTAISINVQNGSSGDTKQDNELARQVATQVDRAVQKRMVEFNQNQARPGGMFSSHSMGPTA